MWHQSARFEKSWPPFFQIWIIFTHLKLWVASARHNFKWVKIKLNNLAVKGLSVSYLPLQQQKTRILPYYRSEGPAIVVSTTTCHARAVPRSGIQVAEKRIVFLPRPFLNILFEYCGEPNWPRIFIVCSASDHQGSNFEFCVQKRIQILIIINLFNNLFIHPFIHSFIHSFIHFRHPIDWCSDFDHCYLQKRNSYILSW